MSEWLLGMSEWLVYAAAVVIGVLLSMLIPGPWF